MIRTAILRAPATWALVLFCLVVGGAAAVGRMDGWIARALSLEQVFHREGWRAESIEHTHGLIEERLARRKTVCRSLLRGEMTLEEAAAEFKELDRWPPREGWELVRFRHPEAKGVEFHCLAVIEFAKGQLASDPAAARAMDEKLGRELETLRARLVHVRLGVIGEEWF